MGVIFLMATGALLRTLSTAEHTIPYDPFPTASRILYRSEIICDDMTTRRSPEAAAAVFRHFSEEPALPQRATNIEPYRHIRVGKSTYT